MLNTLLRQQGTLLAKSGFGSRVILGILTAGLSTTTIGAIPVQANESIDTTPSWNGINSVSPWNPIGGTYSYGQVMTPQEGGNLTDFSFYINPVLSTPDIAYQAWVYQWNFSGGPGFWGPTGASLFNSGTLSFSGTPGIFSEVNINTGGISVSAGIPYVLLLSTVGETNTTYNSTSWGLVDSASVVYSGGDFVYSNNQFSLTDPWDGGFIGSDLAFKANITSSANTTSVPGPLPLLGIAAAFGYTRQLRKRIKGSSDTFPNIYSL